MIRPPPSRIPNWTAIAVWSLSLLITAGFWTAAYAVARMLAP
jgi:hypothetical protein